MRLTTIVLGAILLFLAGTASGQAQGIDAGEAVAMAKKSAGKGWELAFLSNTGVTQSVTSEGLRGPDEALMRRDGKAGQWVVELFKDTPKPVNEGGKSGQGYPFQPVIVTARGASPSAESTIKVPRKLVGLPASCLAGLNTARTTAASKVKTFDVMSVASDVRSNGDCSWHFRFYDLKTQKIVGKVRVSGDGKKLYD